MILSEIKTKEQEFIAAVEARLSYPDDIDPFDLGACRDIMVWAMGEGWNVDETWRFVKCEKNYNPELDEEIAVERSNKILNEAYNRIAAEKYCARILFFADK